MSPLLNPRRAPSITHRAWTTYLEGYTWSHIVTLTTDSVYSRARLVREFRRLVNRLGRISKFPSRFFYVIEKGAAGREHIHALLWSEVHLPNRVVEAQWRLGLTHVRRYDPPRNGAMYLSKELETVDFDAYDLSDDMPPKAHRGTDGVVGSLEDSPPIDAG